jgi:hypothetical protein
VGYGKVRLDPDELLNLLDKATKRHFLVALITITMPVKEGTYGEVLLADECVWMCCSVAVNPPPALCVKALGRNSQGDFAAAIGGSASASMYTANHQQAAREHAAAAAGSGAAGSSSGAAGGERSRTALPMAMVMPSADPDPVDLINGVLTAEDMDADPVPSLSASAPFLMDKTHAAKTLESAGIEKIPLFSFLQRVSSVLPSQDIGILAAVLGRRDWKIDITPHR